MILERLQLALSRPGMFASDGRDIQSVAASLLGDLCFIDEREDDEVRVRESDGKYGKRGVVGAFRAVFGEDCDFTAEVASVFAQHAWSLGYLAVQEPPSREHQDVVVVAKSYDGTDRRMSDIVAELGSPLLVVDGRVLCYRASDDAWVFFDCYEPVGAAYDPKMGVIWRRPNPDPLLRNARIPAHSFDAGLVLTRYGKVVRWGPGWWLRPASGADNLAPAGVADLLRRIEASDPSEALGLRRP